MQRRRFLALGAGLLVAASGCVPREPAGEAGGADGPADGTSGATPQDTPPPASSERPSRPPDASGDRRPPADEPGAGDEADAPDAPDPADDADDGGQPAEVDPEAYPSTAEEWGERVTGVRSTLGTDEPVVALTFDACGGPGGSGYDEALVELLIAEEVPATLFLNKRWIEANPRASQRLADHPLFEIANHGTDHVPLSVDGRSAYGIRGTTSPREVIEEVAVNQEVIERLTGRRPAHFRPGTAYCDEVAVRIVNDMGLDVVGFDIAGDAGATLSAEQVTRALTAAGPGSIALLHMNHPGSGTMKGVADAIPRLRGNGLSFTTVGDGP